MIKVAVPRRVFHFQEAILTGYRLLMIFVAVPRRVFQFQEGHNNDHSKDRNVVAVPRRVLHFQEDRLKNSELNRKYKSQYPAGFSIFRKC